MMDRDFNPKFLLSENEQRKLMQATYQSPLTSKNITPEILEPYQFYLKKHSENNAHGTLIANIFDKNMELMQKLTPRELDLGFHAMTHLLQANEAYSKDLKQTLILSFGKTVGAELGEKLEVLDTKAKNKPM